MNTPYVIYIRCQSNPASVEAFHFNDRVDGRLSTDEVKTVMAQLKLDLHALGYYIQWHPGTDLGSFTADKMTHEIEVLAMPYGNA